MRALLIALLLAGCAAAPVVPDLKVANEGSPGERFELDAAVVKGKTTLIEFYSDHCGPCREMEPFLERRLAASRGDLAIRRLNIDRSKASGIDFESPLARQYQVDAVPSFRVYDASGKLTAQGREAKDQVRQWYEQIHPAGNEKQ